MQRGTSSRSAAASGGYGQAGTSSRSAAASGGYGQADDGFQWVDSWLAANQGRGSGYTAEQWKSYFMGVSKKLSYILRHGAAENGLTLRSDASIALADLLRHRNFRGVSTEEVDLCVEHDAKTRFLIYDEGGQKFIRAQQGHTRRVGQIDQEQLVIPITRQNCPKMAVHGTFGTNVEAIRKEGLKKMGRDHIHMATGLPGDAGVISGCREGADVYLHIDVRRAVASGIPFVLSGNDVLLTSGRDGTLPPEFIRGATNASGEKVLFGFEVEAQAPKPNLVPGMAGYVPKIAAAPDLTIAPPSALSASEKDFLKLVKDFRAVLKIEARRESGETIDKLQSDKLAKKDQLLANLSEKACSMGSNSALLEKNQDVLAMLPASS